MAATEENIHDTRRLMLRTQFKEDVAAGLMRPLVIPYCLLGTFILPVLYLSIPHTKRPWLYQLRFAVMAVIVALNARMMSHSSSTNMASAYAAGLLGTWGIVWNMALLIWMRPQFDSARVERRRRRATHAASVVNGSAAQPNGHGQANGSPSSVGDLAPKANGRVEEPSEKAPDESVAAVLDKYEYFWQAYPEDASFLTRVDWAFDLVTAFRGSGWSHSIPAIPNFARPHNLHGSELVRLDSIPLKTRAGYKRHTTYRSFISNRVAAVAANYLLLDFVGVMMMHDPYFVYGPGSNVPLPAHLAKLQATHPLLLPAVRNAQSLLGIYGALMMVLSFDQLARVVLLRPICGARADLWQYASIFGAFDAILDHGLAGFWGTWWHQTFRLAFVAPTTWLLAHGYLDRVAEPDKARALGSLLAFAQSGLLHGGGSFTTLPRESRWWAPPTFFLLSWAGIVLQRVLCARLPLAQLPRWLRRLGNLAFTALWLHITAGPFVDDMGRAAVWLFEPVPISPCRALGLGHPDDSWWRWDRDHFPVWYWGKTWWETGLGI